VVSESFFIAFDRPGPSRLPVLLLSVTLSSVDPVFLIFVIVRPVLPHISIVHRDEDLFFPLLFLTCSPHSDVRLPRSRPESVLIPVSPRAPSLRIHNKKSFFSPFLGASLVISFSFPPSSYQRPLPWHPG